MGSSSSVSGLPWATVDARNMNFPGLWKLATQREEGRFYHIFCVFQKVPIFKSPWGHNRRFSACIGHVGVSRGHTRKMNFPGRRKLANQVAKGRFGVRFGISGFASFSEKFQFEDCRGAIICHSRPSMGRGGVPCGRARKISPRCVWNSLPGNRKVVSWGRVSGC